MTFFMCIWSMVMASFSFRLCPLFSESFRGLAITFYFSNNELLSLLITQLHVHLLFHYFLLLLLTSCLPFLLDLFCFSFCPQRWACSSWIFQLASFSNSDYQVCSDQIFVSRQPRCNLFMSIHCQIIFWFLFLSMGYLEGLLFDCFPTYAVLLIVFLLLISNFSVLWSENIQFIWFQSVGFCWD